MLYCVKWCGIILMGLGCLQSQDQFSWTELEKAPGEDRSPCHSFLLERFLEENEAHTVRRRNSLARELGLMASW